MIVYFDTTAIVKLLVEEPGSNDAARLWSDATRRVTSIITYPETRAALASARRSARLAPHDYLTTKEWLKVRWDSLYVVGIEESLAMNAGDIAESDQLKGDDAVHLASTLALGDKDVVFATWDRALWRAAERRGLSVAPRDLGAGS